MGISKQKGDAAIVFIFFMLLGLVILIGYSLYKDNTTPSYTKTITQNYEMDKELRGCTVHYLRSNESQDLYVVRCSDKTSTTWEERSGKSTYTRSVTTDNY